MKHKYLLHICLISLATALWSVVPAAAQNKVSGHVSDAGGADLPGVYVLVQGSANGTSTDANGNFELGGVPSTGSLVFSMIGMQEQVVRLDGRSLYDVIMSEDVNMLNETVVIGYGTMIRKDLTSSVAQVDGGALTERASGLNVLQNMAGKMAGVKVTSFSGRPGGSTNIRVRGFGSINASNDPLYVVDGAVGVSSDMINSADIESISVLKDAASTAIYGAKGANGVVLITTKSGKRDEGTITYDGKFGAGFMTRKIHMMNADEYIQMQALAYGYSGQQLPHLVTPMENLFYYKKDSADNYVYDDNGLLIASPIYDTDWWKESTRTAITQDHNLSFSRGNDKSSVYANVGYQDVQGLVKTTYGRRLSATVNATAKINRWLEINGLISMAETQNNSSDQEGTMMQGAVRNINEMPPIVPVKYPDGTWGRKDDYPLSESASNPIQQLEYFKILNKNSHILGNMGLTFHIIDGLDLNVNGNVQLNDAKTADYRKEGLVNWSESSTGNQAYITNGHILRWSNEDYFTYNRNFFNGKLKSNFVLGASWYYYHFENAYVGSQKISSDIFEYYNLGAGTQKVQPSSGMDQNTMNSFYFRTNQTWADKYMLGLTMRLDGSSNFAKGHRYGFFPAVSAGWLVSEEPWFEPVKGVVNQMKLRASYGHVGNSSIGSYRTFSQISTSNMMMNDNVVTGSYISSLGNKDISWETAKQFDAGIDIGLLNDRIQLIADFYIKRTVDLLFDEHIPRSSGFGTLTGNLGTLRNTGFELTLNTHPIVNHNFNWDLDFIFYTNRTIVEKLYGTLENHGGQCEEGKPYMRWANYKLLGTWSTEEAAEAALYGRSPGDYKLEDVNGDYQYSDEDKQYLGSPVPKAEFSMVNNFSWKGFNLMIDIGAAVGHKVSSQSQALYVGQAIYTNSYAGVLGSAWTPDNQNTTLAQLRLPSDAYFGNGSMGSFYLQRADFIRIRNIVLSYDMKRSVLKNVKAIKGLLLGVSIENPLILTPYVGYDPECGWSGDTTIGIDWYTYPKPTTITGNIKISF